MKICTKCTLPQDESEFYARKDRRKGSLKPRCKCCMRGASSTYLRSLSPNEREEMAERKKRYAEANVDKFRTYHQAYRKDHLPQKREWGRSRYQTDLNYRLSMRLRSRLSQALTGWGKGGSAVLDLGCTIPELKAWLEAKFYPHPVTGEAMSWANYGLYGWHIDHKRPLKGFDLEIREQFLEACHYTNLQPLWALDNLKKGAKEAA